MGGAAPCAMMGAIGLQESKFQARDQLEMQNGILVPGRLGPATGFWQFEKNGGVKGVMTHPASRDIARELVNHVGVAFDAEAIWTFFASHEGDELAAVFARLLLLTDPQPLPAPELSNEDIAWNYYIRNWRPGKPHREFWSANWRDACAAVADISTSPVPPTVTPDLVRAAELISELEQIIRRLRLN